LPLTAWAITTGEAGMRTQARGLAAAVAGTVVEKVVSVRWPQRWFPAGWPGVLAGIDESRGDGLRPPWPDVVVTCGRRSAIIGLAAKRASAGRAVLAHVQDPRAPLDGFDLVVAMAHDEISGPKVVKVLTAMHDISPERLAKAAEAWRDRLADLPRPLTAVLVGGPTSNSPFGAREADELTRRLTALKTRTAGGLLLVPSRRTPEAALAVFARAFGADSTARVWDRSGDNPYLGALALADRLVVTGDSVSMVSEALATPHPVEVFALNLRKRHAGFVQTLFDRGMVGLLQEGVEAPSHPPLDATAEAGDALRALLASRRSG